MPILTCPRSWPVRAVALTLALGATSCTAQPAAQSTVPPAASAASPATGNVRPPFRTELEWVVWKISDRVWQIGHTGAPAPALRVEATGDGLDVYADGQRAATLRVDTHLFDPATLRPLIDGLAPEVVARRATGGGDAEAASAQLLDRLQTPTLDVLISEDRRVSAALVAQPGVPALHDQAALLLGAAALREGADVFSDIRPAVARMSAHLALAAALRGAGPSPPSWQVADAMLLALIGRERDALAAAAPLAANDRPAVEQAWARAVALRATRDWRRLSVPADAMVHERLEHARAVRERIGSQRSLDVIDTADGRSRAEWSRIALSGQLSVDAGNRFAAEGVRLELEELQRTAAEYAGATDTTPATVLGLLANTPPTASPTLTRVLDWPLWRDSAARHLAARVVSSVRQVRNQGRPEAAEDRVQELSRTLAGLPTLRYAVLMASQDDAVLKAEAEGVARALAARPFGLPPAAWNALEAKAARVRSPWPIEDQWFSPWVLPGTAMGLVDRSLQPGCRRPATLDEIAQYHALAPSDWWVAYSLAWRRVPGKPTMASVRAHLGPLVEFDRAALWHMREYVPGSASELRDVAEELCTVDHDSCNDYAVQLLIAGDDQRAAAVYDDWFVTASDRVKASQHLTWLVRYYVETGRADRAEALAREAAGVGSADGIAALADFYDMQGRFAEAEPLYRRVQQRYADTAGGLAAYHLRRWRATGDDAAKREGLALAERWFPDGLEEVTPASFEGAPRDGMRLTSFGPRADRAGLRPADIVVAIDGFRVRSYGHYWYLSRLAHRGPLNLIVWRDGRYQRISAKPPQRWLAVGLATYEPQPTATP